MTSFAGIAEAKDTSLAVVAPGIAEALATTAFGLAAAIPASVGYTRIGAALGSAAAEPTGSRRAVLLLAEPERRARLAPQRRPRRLYQPLAEINVTPMVDVMLVLLIVFMVTAPMLAAGMKVDLPKASSAKALNPKEPLVVSVGKDGDWRSDRTR